MENLSNFLSPINVNLSNLLLDPNNPRFAELDGDLDVPEIRFTEAKIQQETFNKMKSDKFNVSELRDTIKTLGFLPMDRIVVRKWKFFDSGSEFYVVIEGNRRITALKWLIDLHDTGKETFNEDQLKNFKNFEVLLLNDTDAPPNSIWILPGLRHVSGIKEWGPYQKANAVNLLRETGNTPSEAAQSLGLSTIESNRLWRSYQALEGMKKDDEYGDFAEPKKYSYFEEVFRKPDVKNWLDWDDNERRFKNKDHLKEFYSWMIGNINEDDDQEIKPKLPEAKSVRQLGIIINDADALRIFRTPEGNIESALAKYESKKQVEWKPIVHEAITMLSNMSPSILRSLTNEDIELISNLKLKLKQVLSDRSKLLA